MTLETTSTSIIKKLLFISYCFMSNITGLSKVTYVGKNKCVRARSHIMYNYDNKLRGLNKV